MPKFSLIIPVDNDEHLKRIIKIYDEEKQKDVEVILLLSSSSDLYESTENIKIIRISDFDHGKTRNIGAQFSQGDILIFMTQDASPASRDFFQRISESFEIGEKIKLVYGRQIPDESNILEKLEREIIYHNRMIIKSLRDVYSNPCFESIFVSDVCLAVDKKVFCEVNGFEQNIICSEEVVLALKILKRGYNILYNPKVSVYHSHNESKSRVFKRWFDVGVFLSNFPEIKKIMNLEKQGIRLAKEELKFIARSKSINLIPEFLYRNFIRYSAMKIGELQNLIPFKLKKRLSLNKQYWQNQRKEMKGLNLSEY